MFVDLVRKGAVEGQSGQRDRRFPANAVDLPSRSWNADELVGGGVQPGALRGGYGGGGADQGGGHCPNGKGERSHERPPWPTHRPTHRVRITHARHASSAPRSVGALSMIRVTSRRHPCPPCASSHLVARARHGAVEQAPRAVAAAGVGLAAEVVVAHAEEGARCAAGSRPG